MVVGFIQVSPDTFNLGMLYISQEILWDKLFVAAMLLFCGFSLGIVDFIVVATRPSIIAKAAEY